MIRLALKIITSVTYIDQRRLNLTLFMVMIVSSTFSINSLAAPPKATNTINASNSPQSNNQYNGTDWVLKNTEDLEVRLSEHQGKPVILVFWATWCPYCKKLLPGIAKLHEKYQAKGLTVFAINIKEDWQPKTYWRNHEYKFSALLNGDEVAELYGVLGVPAVVFISPDGNVLKTAYFSDPNHASLEQFAQFYLK